MLTHGTSNTLHTSRKGDRPPPRAEPQPCRPPRSPASMRTASDIMGVPNPFWASQEYSPVSEAETGSKTWGQKAHRCPLEEAKYLPLRFCSPSAQLTLLFVLPPRSGPLHPCPHPPCLPPPYQLPCLGVQAVGRVAESTAALGLQRHRHPVPVPVVLRGRGAVCLQAGQHCPAPDGGRGRDVHGGLRRRHWREQQVLVTGQGGLLGVKQPARVTPQPPAPGAPSPSTGPLGQHRGVCPEDTYQVQ